ncbi:ComEC/Rec2 family competence protein [Microbacterium sp. RD1]|uniref:ComEC/Rec2 family competence protein n=1 Tax=Microbacterium sp. RD1 TaxID=3457313 RepID=UPI003FA5E6A4
MTAAVRGVRLVPVAGAAWATAAFAVLIPDAAAATAAVLWGGAVVAAALAVRRPATGAVVIALTLAVAGGVSVQVAVAQPARASVSDSVGTGGRAVQITGEVSGRSDRAPSGDVWFDLAARSVAIGGRTMHTSVPVRVGVPVDGAWAAGMPIGATVTLRGVAFPASPGERATVVVRADGEPQLLVPPPGLWGALATLRSRLADAAARLPGPGAALVPGLAVGDTSAVTPALEESMKAASLTHLTAVSGANCAIVVGLGFGAAALCRARRAVRIGAGLSTLGVFVLLVTPEPSVVRAGAMAAVAMVGVGVGRVGSGVAVLCAAVSVLFVLDPWLALSLGFALSTTATASLLVLTRPIGTALGRVMPVPLAMAIAVPLAAQLACGPLLILVDPHVPVLGVLANLLAAPAAPAATVAGFFACLAAPVPVIQDALAAAAWVPSSWIAGVATTIGALPGQRLAWVDGPPGAALLAALGVAVVVALLPLRAAAARRWRAVRAAAVVAVVTSLAVGVGQVALIGVAAPWTVPTAWQIVVCDVGQGDAVLVRAGDATALIDTGPAPEPVAECLRRFGVTSLDLLVLTHFDADHSGGVDAVRGRVRTVLHGPPDVDGARALALLESGGARLSTASAGQEGSIGPARWRVLWPTDGVRLPGNDASVALRIDGSEIPSMLLLGDLSAEAQIRLRAAHPPGRVDVVKVAHHGSADQDDALYEMADADLALIPVGADNDYGHPRETLLSLLRHVGTRIARSDVDGHIAVWRDGSGLHLWREKSVGPAG